MRESKKKDRIQKVKLNWMELNLINGFENKREKKTYVEREKSRCKNVKHNTRKNKPKSCERGKKAFSIWKTQNERCVRRTIFSSCFCFRLNSNFFFCFFHYPITMSCAHFSSRVFSPFKLYNPLKHSCFTSFRSLSINSCCFYHHSRDKSVNVYPFSVFFFFFSVFHIEMNRIIIPLSYTFHFNVLNSSDFFRELPSHFCSIIIML